MSHPGVYPLTLRNVVPFKRVFSCSPDTFVTAELSSSPPNSCSARGHVTGLSPPQSPLLHISAPENSCSVLPLPLTPMALQSLTQLVLALVAAAAVGIVSVIFVLTWVFSYKEGLAWDGGLAEFNWHPVLIVVGFIFLQGIAVVVYRLPWTWQCSKLMMKFIHAGLNLLAFIFAVISLVAVFDFHNAAKIPNMYSLHSWLGLVAVILYCLQLVLGVGMFLIPATPVSWRAAFMPLHAYSGLLLFTSVIAVALMGITEKLIFGLSNPKYKDSPPEAVFVNILGVLLVVFGALILWIATRPSWKRPNDQPLNTPHTNGGGEDNSKVNLSMSGGADADTCSDVRRRNNKAEDQTEG